MHIRIPFALIVLPLLLLNSCRSDPPDMQKYFLAIREARMSDRAYTILLALADVRSGRTALVCERDSSNHTYPVKYIQAGCPRPGIDPDSFQLHVQRQAKLQNSEFETLKKLADSDNSGFVSTQEAVLLQQVFEFGCKFPMVVHYEGRDTSMVLYAMTMNRVELQQTLHDYRDLSAKLASEGGEGLPEVPW